MASAPKWAKQDRERSESKAARIAALYLCRDALGTVVKTDLARSLGISRWTLDRDLAAAGEVGGLIETIIQTIEAERMLP